MGEDSERSKFVQEISYGCQPVFNFLDCAIDLASGFLVLSAEWKYFPADSILWQIVKLS
jgi:hypothetical protein